MCPFWRCVTITVWSASKCEFANARNRSIRSQPRPPAENLQVLPDVAFRQLRTPSTPSMLERKVYAETKGFFPDRASDCSGNYFDHRGNCDSKSAARKDFGKRVFGGEFSSDRQHRPGLV